VKLGLSDAEMEKGTLRCDANISVRPVGSTELRTRCELKNMNSFNFIGRGIEAEVARQIGVYESGGQVTQDTYDFDAASGTLTVHRSKEEAQDYRYFPEPDLVPYEPEPELIERLKAELPELPGEMLDRLIPEVGYKTAWELVDSGRVVAYDGLVREGVDSQRAANVAMNELASLVISLADINYPEYAKLVRAKEELPSSVFMAGTALADHSGFIADPYLEQRSISDTAELEPLIERILAANPGQVEQYRGGKEGLLGFFVGQVMKESGGKANAKVVSELVRAKLSS
jgi:aspartyl-tRNA(Asn)/glutamyl-tRNA(Gln) amidotransferase subunit B